MRRSLRSKAPIISCYNYRSAMIHFFNSGRKLASPGILSVLTFFNQVSFLTSIFNPTRFNSIFIFVCSLPHSTAMAGIGLSTSFSLLNGVGLRPFFVGGLGSLTMCGTALCIIKLASQRKVSH